MPAPTLQALLPRKGCGPRRHFPFVSASLLIQGEPHTLPGNSSLSLLPSHPHPEQALLPQLKIIVGAASCRCGSSRRVPGKTGPVLQRTRLFIGNIKLMCNLTNDSNLNRLLLRSQSGKRKIPLFSKGHNRTFNRFLSKGK